MKRTFHIVIVATCFLCLCAGLVFAYQKNKEEVISSRTLLAQASQGAENIQEASKPAPSQEMHRLVLTPANIVYYTNEYRKDYGLPPLIQRKALNESAQAKNTNMILYQYFAHTQPDGSVTFDRFIDDQKYEFIKAGENLAMGDFSTSKEVVDAWMKSPEHKENILDSVYTEIGVNIQTGTINGKQTIVITQHFGKPRKSCPTVNESTKSAINNLTGTIESIQKTLSEKESALGQNPSDEALKDYNSLVTTYNTHAGELRELIQAYNAQVKAFDECIGIETKPGGA